MHYVLTLFIFTVYQGHSLSLDSYRDRIVVGGFSTEQACREMGDKMIAGFHSQPDPRTLSRDMAGYQCEKESK